MRFSLPPALNVFDHQKKPRGTGRTAGQLDALGDLLQTARPDRETGAAARLFPGFAPHSSAR
jgi:hypothetical protein